MKQIKTVAELNKTFDNFQFTWEAHPLFPKVVEPFLNDCAATEADILNRWNEAIYGDNKPEPKAIEAIITEEWHMRELRRQMGAAQPTLPSLPSPIAIKRAKRLIDSGAADDALMLLAGAESLQTEDLRLLVPQAVNRTNPTTNPDDNRESTTSPASNTTPGKWPPKWLTPITASAIAIVLFALGCIGGFGGNAVRTHSIAVANQTATATAQTATASAEVATVATPMPPTANLKPTPGITVTPTATLEPTTASVQPSPTPPTVSLHTLSLTDNTLALPADFPLPDGVTLPIKGTMTIAGASVEVELKADGSNLPVLTFELTEEQYKAIQNQTQLELPITFTNPNFIINLVAEEQTVQGLPIIKGDKPKWDNYPSQIVNTYTTYLYTQNNVLQQDNNHAIAVLYANLPPEDKNLVLADTKEKIPTQIKQNDQIRILATQTEGSGDSAVTYYLIRTQDGVVGWLPAVFVDGVGEGEATPTPTVTGTPTS